VRQSRQELVDGRQLAVVGDLLTAFVEERPDPQHQRVSANKLAFHDADTDTDTDIDTDILARIVARMSACRSACYRNNVRKSRVSDVSARILARTSVSVYVSASWNASSTERLQEALDENVVIDARSGLKNRAV